MITSATLRDIVICAAALTTLSISLTGCSNQIESPAAPSTNTSTLSESSIDSPSPTPLVDEHSGETLTPQPVARWDDASRAAVIRAAETAMATFARPDLDYKTWWLKLEPLLTTDAAETYVYVDPANIPVRKVTGKGVIFHDTSAYVATVEVPTDAGRYHLLLIRESGDAPWLVSRITPVQESG